MPSNVYIKERTGILHISDMHNDPACVPKLEFIAEHYPNHIIIDTGDSTDDGTAEQYQWVKENVILPRILRPQFINYYSVPGNHNIGSFGWLKQARKLKAFNDTYGTHFTKRQLPNVTIIIDDVALIGLNSNPISWQFWLSFARGNVGWLQRSSLATHLEALKDYTRIVYLHHHPFYRHPFMELSDSEKVMKILRGNCEALLFGHKHVQHRHFGKEDYYDIPLIHAAGALFKEDKALEITIENGQVSGQYVPINGNVPYPRTDLGE